MAASKEVTVGESRPRLASLTSYNSILRMNSRPPEEAAITKDLEPVVPARRPYERPQVVRGRSVQSATLTNMSPGGM